MKKTSDVLLAFESDPDFVRQVALEYIEFGDFRVMESRMNIELGTLELVFYEYPECEEKFDAELERQSQKKLKRESRFRIFKLLRSLDELIAVGREEGGNSQEQLRAAQILAQILQKAINLGKEQQVEEDEMEKLWKSLERERKSKSDKDSEIM